VQTKTTTSWLAGMILLVALAAPAAAQAVGSSTPASTSDTTVPELAVTTGLLHFGGFGSWLGFDANYATKTFTQPATALGLRMGVVVEAGVHKFSGDTLENVQGGVNLTADKFFGPPRIKWYGHVMFGIGHFAEGTDQLFTLAAGADIPLQDKGFKVRAELAQVWDIFSGGHQVAWRYSIGIALPLK
jgi:hypothetical protein